MLSKIFGDAISFIHDTAEFSAYYINCRTYKQHVMLIFILGVPVSPAMEQLNERMKRDKKKKKNQRSREN